MTLLYLKCQTYRFHRHITYHIIFSPLHVPYIDGVENPDCCRVTATEEAGKWPYRFVKDSCYIGMGQKVDGGFDLVSHGGDRVASTFMRVGSACRVCTA